MLNENILPYFVAGGVGLLVGLERERSKARHGDAAPAGIRTFTLAALAGALAGSFESMFIATAVLIAVAALSVAAYLRSPGSDLGLTTEVALLLMPMLGMLAHVSPELTAGLGVAVAVVLAARSRLHAFVRNTLTPQEVHDALLLAGAALIVLPLMPREPLDPWGAVNLRLIWKLAVLIMLINGLGYVALRAMGPRLGLPIAGLMGGFVSSAATHAAMGARVRAAPGLIGGAVAGASLSSLATPVFMAIVLAVAHVPLLLELTLPLLLAAFTAAAYGSIFMSHLSSKPTEALMLGRAFEVRTAVVFALVIAAVLVISTALVRTVGSAGAVAAIAFAGVADAQAAGASAGALAARGELSIALAAVAILVAFTGNALVKVVVSWVSGGRAFAMRILYGQALVLASLWCGWWLVAGGVGAAGHG